MRLGPYQLVRQIGAGGMGEVWVAHRSVLGGREAVALKRLPRRLAGDPSHRKILLEEARRSQLLRHPNIVYTLEAGEADGEIYIAMELIDGLDLARVNRLLALQGERMPLSVGVYIVAEILRGLAYAHDLERDGERISLVHRDVSPHNVMLSTIGEIKLADFGVARLSSEDTSNTHVKGKARYMPPEQLRGDSRSPTVDLFPVGAILQELLDGSVFRGGAIDDARLLGMAFDGLVPLPLRAHEIPPELERVRASLLDPDPKQRPQSAVAALELLLRWPPYQPRATEVAQLVVRLREREAELASSASQTGQATFIRTSDVDDAEGFAASGPGMFDEVEAPDQVLLEFGSMVDKPKSAPIQRELEPDDELDQLFGAPVAVAEPPRPAPAPSPAPAPTPTVSRSRPPVGDPQDLQLDFGDEPAPSVPRIALAAQSAATRPVIRQAVSVESPPRRRAWPLVVGILSLVAVVAAGVQFYPSLELGDDPPAAPTTTLRHAIVAGHASLLDVGLHDPSMNTLVESDIFFDYRPTPDGDPLAALVRGEVEFAFTSLDAFVRAGSPGTIVAILGVPLASEALVLDTVEGPELVSLAALAELEGPVTIASTSTNAALARQLGAAFGFEVAIDQRADDAAVHAELTRAGSPVVAAILREPWLGKAEAAGLTVAVTGLELPLAHVEILVVRDAVLESDPSRVEAVVGHYYAAVERLQRDSARLEERAAEAHGLTPAETQQAFAGLCLFDAAGAARFFADEAKLLRSAAPRAVLDGRFDPVFTLAAATREPPADANRSVHDLDACLAAASPRKSKQQPLGVVRWADPSTSRFEPDTANLVDPARVGELVEVLRGFNAATVSVEVVGHGDTTGHAGRKLGRARADQVLEALRAAELELPLTAVGRDSVEAPSSRVQVIVRR